VPIKHEFSRNFPKTIQESAIRRLIENKIDEIILFIWIELRHEKIRVEDIMNWSKQARISSSSSSSLISLLRSKRLKKDFLLSWNFPQDIINGFCSLNQKLIKLQQLYLQQATSQPRTDELIHNPLVIKLESSASTKIYGKKNHTQKKKFPIFVNLQWWWAWVQRY
jgi:hypothetical protein